MKKFNFGTCNTLIIKANMKMEKTKQLKNFINKNLNTRICILSFQIIFISEIKFKFPIFVIYSEKEGQILSNKVIVQIDSLYRLNINKLYDLLILDETESIFEQLESLLIKCQTEVVNKFNWLINYSERVILIDAHITLDTIENMKRIRS
jgi:hypothetical protein